MKKISISKKVSTLMLRVSLGAVIVFGAIAIAALLILRGGVFSISGELGVMASEDSRAALEERMIDSLALHAVHYAALMDSIMYSYELTTEMIANAAGDIARNPDKYAPSPVAPPDPANGGIPAAQLIWAQGMEFSAIAEDSALMGNIQHLMMDIIDKGTEVAYFIGSENGYFIITDYYSHQNPASIDPRERPWYRQAAANGGLTWTDVYMAVSGSEFSIACAMPYYNNDGSIAGVAATSQNLIYMVEEALSDTARTIGETKYAFIVNELGQVVVSENMKTDGDGNVVWEDLLNSGDAELAAAAQDMVNRNSGVRRVRMDGREYFAAYAPIKTLPWSFVVAIEVEEVIAPAMEGGERILAMTVDALADITVIVFMVIVAFFAVFVLAALLIVYSSKRFASALTEPISVLQDGVRQIADGNLEHIIDIHTGDEIEELGASVNKMSRELKDYIANLQTVTAEKERIGTELDVATRIQASLLPCIFPAFPEREEFDIHASMIPAKEVGGDFYDFYLVDEDTLAVVVADVSGKGVPAALFMVIAKTLIKNNAQLGKTPKEVFETVNNMLCENNSERMFVTAFMGYLDLRSRKLTYVNAGHNPPLIKKGGGRYEFIKTERSILLAYFAGREYREEKMSLETGDILYLYTDGVTEAMNIEEEQYSNLRLTETANKYEGSAMTGLIEFIKKDIDLFVGGAEQADDITMLGLRLN